MFNINSIKESRWLQQPLFKYKIVYKAIVRHESEIIVNFEPKSIWYSTIKVWKIYNCKLIAIKSGRKLIIGVKLEVNVKK